MPEVHEEQYVHLADLTHDSVLLSWGAFQFRKHSKSDHRLVDDEKLAKGRTETIGANSRAYGSATLELRDEDGTCVRRAETSDKNHVWVHGLEPDTVYSYTLSVNGKPWAARGNLDWKPNAEGSGGVLADLGRTYTNRFRTHVSPEADAELTFAVLGDFGVGVGLDSPASRRQRRVAEALELAVERFGVRLVLTTGDNVYLAQPEQFEEGGSGEEDDDWFFPFYQPYRYVLNRVPFYPAVGNHDASDTEQSDDRDQLEDNFYLSERFRDAEMQGRASLDPGLFYRFGFGNSIEFVAIDTTLASELESERWFDDPKHLDFLKATFDPQRTGGIRWQFPFSHHPPFCAGPAHDNDQAMIKTLVPLFECAGVRAVFSGHEHNFQYSCFNDTHYFVSGAGGKLREEPPRKFQAAHTKGWAADANLLIVKATRDAVVITPVCGTNNGELLPLSVSSPTGGKVHTPFVVRA